MKFETLNYLVPNNRSELEAIAGTSVGVKIGRLGCVNPMVYFGINEEEQYLFLKQYKRPISNGTDPSIDNDHFELTEYVPINRVCVIRNNVNDLGFSDEGVILRSDKIYSDIVGPNSEDYYEKVESLKSNKLWMETR